MGETVERLLTTLAEFVPRLVGAVVVLLVALVVAWLFRRYAARFLESLGLDDLFDSTGAQSSLWPLRSNSTVSLWDLFRHQRQQHQQRLRSRRRRTAVRVLKHPEGREQLVVRT